MTTPTHIRLGNIVKCQSTGFTGMAVMFATYLGGTVHVCIQPPATDNGTVCPKDIAVDACQVDFVSDGIADKVHPQDPVISIELGDHAEDIITGFNGVATMKLESLQGCVQFAVTPTTTDNGAFPESTIIDHKRLSKISDGAKDQIAESTSGCFMGPKASKGRIRRS
jgi:hypothetical protein